ncbi:MAG TPA: hypothetical protein VFG83_16220 [Kofleriaceae bacterium]|nr:hypothetical protein [Kofleriaceae bacterium]
MAQKAMPAFAVSARGPPCPLIEPAPTAIVVDTPLRPDWEIWEAMAIAPVAIFVLMIPFSYIARCSGPNDGC